MVDRLEGRFSSYFKVPQNFCYSCPYRQTRLEDDKQGLRQRAVEGPVQLSNVRNCDKDYFSQIEKKCLIDGSSIDK